MSIVDPAASGLADRPRVISTGVTISAFLGGRGVQAAWAMLVPCLALFWYLAMDPGFTPFADAWRLGATIEAPGVVHSLIESDPEEMGIMPGTGQTMERFTILGIHYGYMGPDGTPYTGVAMDLQQGYHETMAHVGAPLTVIHSESDPEKSYIKGLNIPNGAEYQLKAAGFWIAVLLSTFCVVVAALAIRRGFGLLRLFSQGIVTQGRIVAINSVPAGSLVGLRRLVYALSERNGEEVSILNCATDDELSGEDEPILLIPHSPNRAFPISLVPGHLEIDGESHVSEGDSNPHNCLWLPALCIMGYTWFALSQMDLMSPPWVF